jgi:hypothetical protein
LGWIVVVEPGKARSTKYINKSVKVNDAESAVGQISKLRQGKNGDFTDGCRDACIAVQRGRVEFDPRWRRRIIAALYVLMAYHVSCGSYTYCELLRNKR